MSGPTAGGPGGKWLTRIPTTPADWRELIHDVREQVDQEPQVLEALDEAVQAHDRPVVNDILVHLRDLFVLVGVLLKKVSVADMPAGKP